MTARSTLRPAAVTGRIRMRIRCRWIVLLLAGLASLASSAGPARPASSASPAAPASSASAASPAHPASLAAPTGPAVLGGDARADQLLGAFQATLDSLCQTCSVPGATAAYVLPDGTTGCAASGLADLESATPMTPRARMLSASIGKTYVAATVIALALEGALDLDAPIARWLGERPWFGRLPNRDSITVRHLLTHTSGLADHVHLQRFQTEAARHWPEGDNAFTPEGLVAYVLEEPPLFAPGAGWAYSDTGYILLGLIIEAVTGRPCFEEMSERFTRPLGLTATSPSDRRDLEGLVPGYTTADNPFGFPCKSIGDDGRLAWHPGLEWTGGGWVSSSLDLARWGAALFGGNAMPGNYLGQLLRPVPVSADSDDLCYGAGVAIYRSGPFGPAYGHGGWIPGYVSSLRHYPEHGITIAFQVNSDAAAEQNPEMVPDMEASLARVVLANLEGAP